MEGTEFYSVDETGKEWVWKYPIYNNYQNIVPIWGVYTGINSPNNSLPIAGNITAEDGTVFTKQSYLDRIAFQHDAMYHDLGTFNKFSDYVLISRISQNMDKMIFQGERETAQVALNYFSTLGTVVRKIYGDNVSKGIIDDLYTDVYNIEITKEDKEQLMDLTKVELGNSQVYQDIAKETNADYHNFEDPRIRDLINEIDDLTFELD